MNLSTWSQNGWNKMTTEEFKKVLDDTIAQVNQVLGNKAVEYATADWLHSFKKAAHLEGKTPEKALTGMMVKHTVSIYDMVQGEDTFPLDKWDEKIVDHINYLILLKALVVEKANASDKE